jgi:Flp pilus assembly protein TadG
MHSMARQALFSRLCRSLRAFRSAKAGNVALTFAFSLLPVIGLVGAGVDYSRASRIRTILLAAADAAALGSVAKVSQGYTAALSMANDGSIAAGETQALNIFNGEINGRTGFTVTSLTATVAKANWQVTSTVQFTATVPTMLMEVLGWNNLTVTGSAVAANGMPTFIDFYLLLDNTPSMGVGATPADVATMVNNTPDQCAFACHDKNGEPNDYYTLAKSLGVTMRIDVLRSATQQLMDTATATAAMPSQFRMAIYHFGTQAENKEDFYTVTKLTSPSNAKSLAANIDLMTVNGQNQFNDRDTQFDTIIPAMNAEIPAPGLGQSSSSPQKVLFFVSDGVADQPDPGNCSQPLTGNRCQEPLNVSLCTAIKNRGIRIAVLYTTYLPLPTNSWYNTWIAPFNQAGNSQIGANMQACASPGLYFEVSPNQGISDAMNALFEKAVATARLTQ